MVPNPAKGGGGASMERWPGETLFSPQNPEHEHIEQTTGQGCAGGSSCPVDGDEPVHAPGSGLGIRSSVVQSN